MASEPKESTDMDVKVLAKETLLQVLDIGGLQLEDSSSRLVRLEPKPCETVSLARDRPLDVSRLPRDRLSPTGRPRGVSEWALLRVLGVRRSMFPVMVNRLPEAVGPDVSAGAPNNGSLSLEIDE